MAMTDTATLVVAALLTAAFFVAAVLAGPRLVAPVWGVLARAALVLLTAVGLVVTVGLKLNDDNGWYTSWSDFAGTDSTAGEVATHGGAAGAAAGGGDAAPGGELARPPLPDPGRRLQTFEVTGERSRLTLPVLVYLPESYERSPQRRYPVIVAYHGYPGTPTGWTKTMGVGNQIDTAVAQHRIAESIVVVPQINTPLGRDGECENGPAGTPQLETWLTQDVPAFARSRLRTVEDRGATAAMGYSAGGYCAAVAGVLHPETFGASVVLSGYFRPDFAGNPPVLPPDSAAARRYDLVAAITRDAPRLAMWIQAGQASQYWPQTQAFVAAVKSPMSVTTEIQPDSGHRWDVWKAQVPAALAWLGTNIPGFRPSS